MMCPILGGILSGIFIDRKLGTTPWAVFILTIVGMAFSLYAVYRVIAQMQNSNHGDEERNI